MTAEWRNWSGSEAATPSRLARPKTEAELSALVAEAASVRVAGAGHSFTPLCVTDGLLLDLSELEGGIELAADGRSAWAPAGMSLATLTERLWALGVSLPNQGDVNPQALAGAIATGTHGTGAELGSLSTFAEAFRLVLADGSAVECSAGERPELFQAQRLSLGLLGVATRIRVSVLPAFHLVEQIRRMPLAEALERFDEIAAAHRHAEFFVFPYADHVLLKTLHPGEAEGEFKPVVDIDESVFRFACEIAAAFPPAIPAIHKLLTGASGKTTRRVGPAYAIFPSERTVRFEEMEYELPRAAGLPALREAVELIRHEKSPVAFPFEFRWTAADDIWLSPFNKGPGASISMHQYHRMDWRAVFAPVEPVFRAAGGRPHWAKRHFLTRTDVEALYPKLPDFLRVRAEVDPTGKFANGYLAGLFGIARTGASSQAGAGSSRAA